MRCSRFTLSSLGILGFSAFLTAGCAPATFPEGLPWSIRQYHLHDAKTQNVRGRPDLRVNRFLLDRLQAAVDTDDASIARQNLKRVVAQCHRLATDSLNNEIDRLPPAALKQLWQTYFPKQTPPTDLREPIRQKYLPIVEKNHQQFLQRLNSKTSIDSLRAWVDNLVARVEPSVKDHYGHGLLLQMVMDSHPEDRGPMKKGGLDVDLYIPDEASLALFREIQPDEREQNILLARLAPRIVQERIPGAAYPPEDDKIGTVALKGRSPHYQVLVQTDVPSIYAYWQYTLIGGRKHLQFIYTYWYPHRPALKTGDTEEGHIDGSTVRITLDSTSRPAFFEAIMNCGCHHRCYPSAAVEAASGRQYHAPLSQKRFALERRMPKTPDWILPEIVQVPDQPDIRPIVFNRAGHHLVASVTFDEKELKKRHVLHRRAYHLRPYATLETLPTAEGFGSMFGADGLVHYADRLEGWLLSGTGMLSAGQPRQRGTRRIYWDQYDFDDPHLLEKCLRLPSDN